MGFEWGSFDGSDVPVGGTSGWWTALLHPFEANQWTLSNYQTVISSDGMGNAFKHGCLSFSDAQTAAHSEGATNSQVLGLNISNCSGDAISANGHGFIFTGNTLHDNVGAGVSLSSSRTYGTFVDTAALQAIFDNFPAFPVSGTDVNNFAQQLATVLVTLNPSTIAGNFIFSNDGDGIWLFSENLGAVFVSGNFIGTDPTGDLPLGNAGAGVRLSGNTFGNMIGPGNVIGDNANGINDSSPTVYLPNFVMGNRIGVPSVTPGLHVGNTNSGITTDTKPDGDLTHKNPTGQSLLIGPGNIISDNKGAANSNDPARPIRRTVRSAWIVAAGLGAVLVACSSSTAHPPVCRPRRYPRGRQVNRIAITGHASAWVRPARCLSVAVRPSPSYSDVWRHVCASQSGNEQCARAPSARR